jgi:cell division septum initiation protein DivIVA
MNETLVEQAIAAEHAQRVQDLLEANNRYLERARAAHGVADGLASRLDIARVDRLRLLGNGVVPLAAAYAVRTLATRLAGRGSAGAAKLMGMMEEE